MTEETKTGPFTHQPVFSLCTDNKSLKHRFPDPAQNKADTTSNGINAEKNEQSKQNKSTTANKIPEPFGVVLSPAACLFVVVVFLYCRNTKNPLPPAVWKYSS